MKLGEVQKAYQLQYRELADKQSKLYQQREALQLKMKCDKTNNQAYQEEAATLELSIQNGEKKVDETIDMLDRLSEIYTATWNAEVARQQADAGSGMAAELRKIMEVARRIANGDIVPATDEQKLMEYSMELYQAAKNMAVMNTKEKREEHDSLWKDEEDTTNEYDPQGKADNVEMGDIAMPTMEMDGE